MTTGSTTCGRSAHGTDHPARSAVRPARPAARPARPAANPVDPAAGSPRPAPRRNPPTLRLTRRGRVVVTALLLGIVLALSVFVAAQSAATGERGVVEETRTVVVQRGDTLWDIADEAAEPGGIREMVHRIQTLNALPGPALVEGQQLAVPVG